MSSKLFRTVSALIVGLCLVDSGSLYVLSGTDTGSAFLSKKNLALAQGCKPVDAILVIDKSGSMQNTISGEPKTKMESAKESSNNFIDLLGVNDHIGVVSFSDGAVLDQQLTDDKTSAKNAVSSLIAGGGTWLDKGINKAWNEFDTRGRLDSPKAMIILTDGKPDNVVSAQNEATIAKNKGIKLIVIGYDIDSTSDPAGTRDILKSIASTLSDYYEAPTTADLQNIYNALAAQMCDSNPPVITGISRLPSGTVFSADAITITSIATDNQASDWGLEVHRIEWTQNNWATTNSCNSGLVSGVKTNSFNCVIGPFASGTEIKYRSYAKDLAQYETFSSTFSFRVATVTITAGNLLMGLANTITAQISDPQGKANLDKYYIEIESPPGGAIKISKTEMSCGGTGSLYDCSFTFTPLLSESWDSRAKIIIYPWDLDLGFHNPPASQEVDVIFDTTPPSVSISQSPSNPVLNTDSITLTSTAADASGLQNQKIIYWVNAAQYTYNCDDISPQDGKCDADPSKDIGNISINIGPYTAGTTIKYQAAATDNWNNTASTAQSSFTVYSAECYNADRTPKANLTTCTGGKCCGGICDTSFSCSLDDECRQEICSGASWTCQAANAGGNCCNGASCDGCYPWSSGCAIRDYSCASGQCNYVNTQQNADSCVGVNLKDYSCSGSNCNFLSPMPKCDTNTNWDGDSIACDCDCDCRDIDERINVICNSINICFDTFDNDCDGLTDCQEPACDNVAPATSISAYDSNGALISDGGNVLDINTNRVSLTTSSFEAAACASSPNVISRVRVFYNVDSGPWNSIFDCVDSSPRDGLCDSDNSKNISNFTVEIPINGFPGGTRVGYRSEATDSAPNPNTGADESYFNVISEGCQGHPDLDSCAGGGKCCAQVCDTSYSCPLDSECAAQACSGISWTCAGANEGNSCLSTAWTKYRSIIIDNSSNPSLLTDYQVKLTIPYDSDMQADFDDLRFVDTNGNNLSHWVENKLDGISATLWVKIPSIPANGKTTIYMYYGNPVAISASSVSSTFIADSIYTMSGSCSDGTNCAYMDNHAEADAIRGYAANICTNYVNKIYWGSVCNSSAPGSSVRNNFYSRFRFLFLPDVTGTWYFAVDSDDPSEIVKSNADMYGGTHEHTGIASWYGGHGWCNCQTHNGAISLTAGQAVWLDYMQEEWGGGEAAVAWALRPSGAWNNLSTANYPNQIFARKYTSPEPSILTQEEQGIYNLGGENFRRRISQTIINSTASALTNYQLRIDVSRDGDMQPDFDDIRFTASDGTTLLPYWRESYISSTSAVFWVRVPSIPASSATTKIYMYYGNPLAVSISDGTATFDFFDDFEGTSLDTNKWQTAANDYSVSNGILRINTGAVGLKNALAFNIQSGYMVESKTLFNIFASNYSGTIPEVSSSRFTASSNGNADATVLYMRDSGSRTVSYWIGNGSASSYNVGTGSTGWSSSEGVWYKTGVSVDSGTVKLWRDDSDIKTFTGISWAKNIKYLSLGAFNGSNSSDIQDTSYDWVRVRKYVSTAPFIISTGAEQGSTFSTGCFAFDGGCRQTGSPKCQSGYCNAPLTQNPDYCQGINLIDYECSGGNCQLVSSGPDPSCDTEAPTVSLEAKDNTDVVISNGVEIAPSLTNKVTLNSVAFDNYILQSHQLQYRKNGGNWESCEDLDDDGNYDVGECTNNDLSFNLEVVSISRASISIKIGPFNNGDIVDYKVIAVDTAQPAPYSVTDQKYFSAVIPNTPPTVTPSTITVYPSANDYWKGENQAANCWKSLQVRVTWIYNDTESDPQDAYQIEVYDDPVLRDGTHLVEDSCNKTGIGPPGTCAAGNFSNEYIITLLQYGNPYWWRIKVFDGRDWSNWQEADGLDFSTPSHPYPTVDFNFNPLSPNVSEMVIFTQDSDCYTAADPYSAVDCGTGTTLITHIGWDFYRVTDTQPNPPNGTGESLNISIDNLAGINPGDTYNYTYYSNITYRVYLEIEDQDGYRCSLIKKITVGGMKYPWWKEILPK